MAKKYLSNFIDFKGRKFDIEVSRLGTGFSVQTNVPADAVFTDTTYDNLINHLDDTSGSYTIPLPSSEIKESTPEQFFLNAAAQWTKLTVEDEESLTKRSTVKDYSPKALQSVIFGKQDDDRALSSYSLVTGNGTNAQDHQFTIGSFNSQDENSIFIIGNGDGAATEQRKNCFAITKDGDMKIKVNNNDSLKIAMDNLRWQEDNL